MIKTAFFSRLLFFLSLAAFVSVQAQSGQEWIIPGQSYVKIPVAREGIYQVTYAQLVAAGLSVPTDPAFFQLFHRGVEQAMSLEGTEDLSFDPGDYILFYGKGNDGGSDRARYADGSPQPYYNLYSDTTFYFVTVRTSPGRRMERMGGDGSGLPSPTHHLAEELLALKDAYNPGESYRNEVFASTFDAVEGWTGLPIDRNSSRDYLLQDIAHVYTTGGQPQLKIRLTGWTSLAHLVDIYVGPSNRLLSTTSFSGYSIHDVSFQLEWTDISLDGKLNVRISLRDGGAFDRVSASFIQLTYPQATTSAGNSRHVFNLPPQGSSAVQLIDPDASAAVQMFDITDPTSVKQLIPFSTAPARVVIPGATSARKVFLTTEVIEPVVKPVTFMQIPSGHDYIIISHPALRKPAASYADPVQAYADYRASEQGGAFHPLVVNMQDLYDRFNYGEVSPNAIYNFMQFLQQDMPRYLFLIGKGLNVTYRYHRFPEAYPVYKDLVPAAGYPPSDMLYTTNITTPSILPAIPTGRLTATTPLQVAAYLNKVKETEAAPFDDLNRKKLLHLSGGIEAGEPELFKSYLSEFAVLAEGLYLGGKVSAIAKQSREIQRINIAEEVNKGLNLITFFGHSSATTLDFDIGFVTDPVMGYNNKGKYPVLFMNGCEAGTFFDTNYLFGEDWIHAQNKGAVGFIAHASYGLIPSLRGYARAFYEVGYGDSVFLTKGIGDIQKETARRFIHQYGANLINLAQIQQMILLGDPALQLFGARFPDLEINRNNVGIVVPAQTNSSSAIELVAVVRNFGQARTGFMRVEVEQTLANGSVRVYDTLVQTTLFSDSIRFPIPRYPGLDYGNSSFKVTVDPDGIIEELSEANNSATIQYFIPYNSTRNLFPAPFSIVRDKAVDLVFQSTIPVPAKRKYLVEMDTTDSFNSPFLQTFAVTGNVLTRQSATLAQGDSVVHFWRTRLDSSALEGNEWEVASFTYIDNGPEGWTQRVFEQLKGNPLSGLSPDEQSRKFQLSSNTTSVDILTFGSSTGKLATDVQVKIDGAEFNLYSQAGGGFGCRNNTLNLIAFNRESAQPYAGLYFKWYEILYTYGGRRLICGREPFVINSFTPAETETGNNDDLIAYIDAVDTGDSVVLYNMGDAGVDQWSATVKNKLRELGIEEAQWSNLMGGNPFVIFARKGSEPGAARVYFPNGPDPANSELRVNGSITGRSASGILTSPLIGPAQSWEQIFWQQGDLDTGDETHVSLKGVTFDGREDLLIEELNTGIAISYIDPATYPYMRLEYHVRDDIDGTAAELRNWLVRYTRPPEGMVIFRDDPRPREIFTGESWSGKFFFTNISQVPFDDSLTVNFEIANVNEGSYRFESFKIAAPPPGDTTFFEVLFPAQQVGGVYDLTINVNPQVLAEQYYFNNVVALPAYLIVREDDLHPVLEVTFDNRQLLNNDFVSADPKIRIRLWDENKVQLKQDTLGVHVFLTPPCADEPCPSMPVFFSNENVTWTPAGPEQDFSMYFEPHLEAGVYRFTVNASDGSGNPSGEEPYEIAFQVSAEEGIIFSHPYPIPFTQVVYIQGIIRGADADYSGELEIIDTQGRSIRKVPLPTPIVGTNEWAWDGKDHWGQSVGPGVYVYKLKLASPRAAYSKSGKLVYTPR